MAKTVAIAAVVVLAVLGLSTYSYTMGVFGPVSGSIWNPGGNTASGLGNPGTGSLSIYLIDSPHSNATLKYLLLNVTSVTLRYGSLGSSCSGTNSTTTSSGGGNHTFVFKVPSSVGTNVNITSLHGQALLLGATNPPAGQVVQITLGVTGAEAFWTSGPPTHLKVVANGKLMVPVHFTVNPEGSTTLTIDVTPGDIHVSQGNMKVLTPVIHVKVVGTGGCPSSTTSSTSSGGSSTSTSVTTSTNSTVTSVSNSTSTTSSVTNSTSTSTSSTNSTSSSTSTSVSTNSTSTSSTGTNSTTTA